METTELTKELVQLVESSGLEMIKQNQIAETLGVFSKKLPNGMTQLRVL